MFVVTPQSIEEGDTVTLKWKVSTTDRSNRLYIEGYSMLEENMGQRKIYENNEKNSVGQVKLRLFDPTLFTIKLTKNNLDVIGVISTVKVNVHSYSYNDILTFVEQKKYDKIDTILRQKKSLPEKNYDGEDHKGFLF